MRLTILLAAVTTLGIGIVACTTQSNSSSSSGGPGDGGASDSSAVDPNRGRGKLTVTELVIDGTSQVSGFAGFTAPYTPTPPEGITCTEVKEGACTWSECVVAPFDAAVLTEDAGPSIPSVGAGELTLFGASLPTAGVKANLVTGLYDVPSTPVGTFAGARFTMKATGADVPAFEIAATAPSRVALTAPTCAGDTCSALDGSSDIPVQWTGGGTGTVVVRIYPNIATGDRYGTIQCAFPSAPGGGTISRALASRMAKGDVKFVQWEEASERAVAGTYDLELLLTSSGVSGKTTMK